MTTDLEQLRQSLAEVARRARSHSWYRERPWSPTTHTWIEGHAIVVDLHDLGKGTARLAAESALAVAPSLDVDEIVLVTGRGRHSIGPGVLKGSIEEFLRAEVTARGLAYRPRGPGRWAIVLRRTRRPWSFESFAFWLLLGGLSAGLLAAAWLATR